MARFVRGVGLWLVLVGNFVSSICLAGAPSVDEVLRICRENREAQSAARAGDAHRGADGGVREKRAAASDQL